MRRFLVVLMLSIVFVNTGTTSGQESWGKSSLVVFTDPGLDDTLANIMLAKAASRGDVELLAVITHFGCTNCDNASRHGCRTFKGIVPKVPVIRGSSEPLELPPGFKQGDELPHYYDLAGGKTHGLCGVELPKSEEPDERGGMKRVAELILASAQPVKLVALGPCTDLAKLLTEFPAVHKKVKTIVLMAGAIGHGNSGPEFLAEFNVYLDVRAFKVVLDLAKDKNIPTEVVPWDMPLLVWRSEVGKIKSRDPWGEVCKDAITKYFPIHNGDGVPGDLVAKSNSAGQVWFATDPKVSLWLLKPELSLKLPTKIYVVTDRTTPDQFGRTVTRAPKEAHSGPYEIDFVIPAQPEIVRQEMFLQLGLTVK